MMSSRDPDHQLDAGSLADERQVAAETAAADGGRMKTLPQHMTRLELAHHYARILSRADSCAWDVVHFEALELIQACLRSNRDYRAEPDTRVLATYRNGRPSAYDEWCDREEEGGVWVCTDGRE